MTNDEILLLGPTTYCEHAILVDAKSESLIKADVPTQSSRKQRVQSRSNSSGSKEDYSALY